jgi:UDP-N-acetylmuramoyl-tripeptide--D-alanyl-D-alanine ligase
MNRKGEIARLTEIADPTVGVITNIGPVHLEYLGSIDAVAEAKGELFRTMSTEATAVFNSDDERVAALARRFPGKKISFGLNDAATVRAEQISDRGEDGLFFKLIIGDAVMPVELSLVGTHNVMNALAAAAAAAAVGIPPDSIGAGLTQSRHVALRHEIIRIDDDLTIINDCYNANPVSMEAALATFSRMKGDDRGIVVLGDMFELGSYASDLHRELGGKAARAGADYLLAIGSYAPDIKIGAVQGGMDKERVSAGNNFEDLVSLLLEHIEEPATVLVKGSRKMALERIAARIEQVRGRRQSCSNG